MFCRSLTAWTAARTWDPLAVVGGGGAVGADILSSGRGGRGRDRRVASDQRVLGVVELRGGRAGLGGRKLGAWSRLVLGCG